MNPIVNREITTLQIGDIVDYESAHKIGNTIPAIKESIKIYGINQPISVDKNHVIVTGRAVWKAAKELGYETIPAIVLDDLTDEQIAEYRIADDKTSEFARWNEAKLRKELSCMGDVRDLQFCFNENLSALFRQPAMPKPSAPVGTPVTTPAGNVASPASAPAAAYVPEAPSKEEAEAFRKKLNDIDRNSEVKTKTYLEHVCTKCGKKIIINLK